MMFVGQMRADEAESGCKHGNVIGQTNEGEKVRDEIDRHDEIGKCGQQRTTDAQRHLGGRGTEVGSSDMLRKGQARRSPFEFGPEFATHFLFAPRLRGYQVASLLRAMGGPEAGARAQAQAAAQQMKVSGQGGSIVNVASILGKRVAGHVTAYAASKGGVMQLTRAMALEWARYGIRVNALCPGYIETELNSDFFQSEPGLALIRRIPQRRIGQPEYLDGAMLLLASDLGTFIAGADLAVDGGHLVSSL